MAEEHAGLLAGAARNAQAFCIRTWWMFLIGGIASVIFGILAIINPGAALVVLATFFAAYIVVDGVANIWGSVTNRDDGWVFTLVFGIVGVVVGGYALLNPALSMTAFMMLVALMAVLFGISMVSLGWKVRQVANREWILYAIGGLSIVFGVMIFLSPAEQVQSVVWLIAAWAIITGGLRVWFALRIRNVRDNLAGRIKDATG